MPEEPAIQGKTLKITSVIKSKAEDHGRKPVGIYMSALITAFIGLYPPAPSAYEPAPSDFEWPSRESRACKCASAGCVKGLFFGCGRRPRYNPGLIHLQSGEAGCEDAA